jgi:hypothetical protein
MNNFWRDMKLDELSDFLLSGHPTILAQLLVINTVLMIMFIIRRLRGQNYSVRHVTYVLQWILLFGNLIVLMEQQWMPMADDGIHAIMWKYRNFTPYT